MCGYVRAAITTVLIGYKVAQKQLLSHFVADQIPQEQLITWQRGDSFKEVYLHKYFHNFSYFI